MTANFLTESETETRAVARDLVAGLAAGTTILLSGDLGAGKTAFVKGLAEGLGIDAGEVTSPTFTIVHEYSGGRLPLVHVDLYRLERAELDEVGLDTEMAGAGIVAVEWAERLARRPLSALAVRISDEGGDRRSISIYSDL
jgi:tRNA threonylcarbamoyladenosine biosynthesis protein TsaE